MNDLMKKELKKVLNGYGAVCIWSAKGMDPDGKRAERALDETIIKLEHICIKYKVGR